MLDKGVGNGIIVRPEQISIQAQMSKKKPYQMGLRLLGDGLGRGGVYEDQDRIRCFVRLVLNVNVTFMGNREGYSI
ncbi:hypothetical protein [Pseudomonas sp.]|uniref:hypothetical protein n=1 Tax=Pseudomonas sp. TaxID=306 RepID=UPI003D6F208D